MMPALRALLFLCHTSPGDAASLHLPLICMCYIKIEVAYILQWTSGATVPLLVGQEVLVPQGHIIALPSVSNSALFVWALPVQAPRT